MSLLTSLVEVAKGLTDYLHPRLSTPRPPPNMDLYDNAVYYTCCAVVILHTLSALLVVTQRKCAVYATAFLISSAMWINVTILNLWFFLPIIVREIPKIEFETTGNFWLDATHGCRAFLLSNAALHTYMALFGWIMGGMSVCNSLAAWQMEGCDSKDAHHHSGTSALLIRQARRVENYVGIWNAGYMPFMEEDVQEGRKRSSYVFAGPRWMHQGYLFVLSPPIKLLGASKFRNFEATKCRPEN